MSKPKSDVVYIGVAGFGPDYEGWGYRGVLVNMPIEGGAAAEVKTFYKHNDVLLDYADAKAFAIGLGGKVGLDESFKEFIMDSRGRYYVARAAKNQLPEFSQRDELPCFIYALCLDGRPVYYGLTTDLKKEIKKHLLGISKVWQGEIDFSADFQKYVGLAFGIKQEGRQFDAHVVYYHYDSGECLNLLIILLKLHRAWHGSGTLFNAEKSIGAVTAAEIEAIDDVLLDYSPVFVGEGLYELEGMTVDQDLGKAHPAKIHPILEPDLTRLLELEKAITVKNYVGGFYGGQEFRGEASDEDKLNPYAMFGADDDEEVSYELPEAQPSAQNEKIKIKMKTSVEPPPDDGAPQAFGI